METGHPRESKQFGLASSEGLSLCDITVKACVKRRDLIEPGSQREKRERDGGGSCFHNNTLTRTSSRRSVFIPLVRHVMDLSG